MMVRYTSENSLIVFLIYNNLNDGFAEIFIKMAIKSGEIIYVHNEFKIICSM